MKEGTQYFKSKDIAKGSGLSSKQVGTSLFYMSKKKLGNIEIIEYARSISTTWKAKFLSFQEIIRRSTL